MTIRTLADLLPMAQGDAARAVDRSHGEILHARSVPMATPGADPAGGSAFPSSVAVQMSAAQADDMTRDLLLYGNAFAQVRDGRVDMVLRPATVRIEDGVAIVDVDYRDQGEPFAPIGGEE